MMQLFYSPGTACLAPHFLLEELGLPYELVLVDTSKQEHQQAAYLKLNPKGKIPLLIDVFDGDELHLTESAAICMHLADKYAVQQNAAHFSPALGSVERALLNQWMMYLSNTLQAELLSYFYPERLADNAETAEQIKKHAEQRVAEMLVYIDTELAKSDGDFFLGKSLSIADLFLFMLCRWTRNMHKPARDYTHLSPYLARLVQRPAIANSFAQEALTAPLY
nr:glutathione S-transferase family protein [uncultured Undibacterium sp.]